MKKIHSILACLAVALTGCASFYTGGNISEVAERIKVPARQRSSVNDFSVSAAAKLAVDNSVELKAERDALDAREGAWRLGLRDYLPVLELDYGSDERIALYAGDAFTKRLSVSLSQPLWDGGRLSATRALEAADIALARGELERKARDVGEAAISAYRAVAAARARLAVKRESLARAVGDRDVLAAEVQVGVAIALDLLEADASLAGLEIELAKSELELAQAESELTEVLGVEAMPSCIQPLETNARLVVVGAEEVAAMAVVRSPDLLLARYGLIRKRAEAKAAAYAWLPTLGVKASATASGSSFPLCDVSWSVGLAVNFSGSCLGGSAGVTVGGDLPNDRSARSSGSLSPVPDPAGLSGVRQAALAYELEKDRYAMRMEEIDRTARSAVADCINAGRIRDLRIKALELAEQHRRTASLRLELGQAIRSEALQAELERATREVDLIDASAELVAAERRIERLLDSPPGSLETLFLKVERSDR